MLNSIEYETEQSEYTSQSEALLQLILGNNVFLAGPAGSGKSYIINKYCELVKKINKDINISRTSTTGLSALNIKGQTIHSFTGAGISAKPYAELKQDHKSSYVLWKKSLGLIKKTKILIIDEVSMFSEAQMQFLRDRMEDVLGNKLDDVQVIVAGDFCQLAPVANQQQIRTYGQSLANYCYATDAWKKFHFVNCYLDRIYRAKDTSLQEVLDAISTGHGDTERVHQILRKIPISSHPNADGVPILTSTNKKVYEINKQRQQDNLNQEFYSMTKYDDTKEVKIAQKMAKERDVAKELRLKVGDTVMITTNDMQNGFGEALDNGPTLKNGMIGELVDFRKRKKNEPIRLYGDMTIGFKFEWEGKTFLYKISRYHEQILDTQDNPIAGFTQYPLKLAYAISIHKSQGQTFTKIAVDLKRCWAPGLGYVALSRATNLDGITLINSDEVTTPWNRNALQIDPKSMQIKKALMINAKRVRKQYTKVYPIIAADVDWIILNRNNYSLQDLVLHAYNRLKAMEEIKSQKHVDESKKQD